MSLAEAEDFYAKYMKAVPNLFAHQDRLVRRARKEGYITTYFGLPIRLRWYFENGMGSFASRLAKNAQIQGTAADILKFTILKTWKNVFNNPKYRDDIVFKATIHDELDFGIRKNKFTEIAREMEKNMIFTLPQWCIPIDCEVSFGRSFGEQFNLRWDEATQDYIPKLK